MVAGRFKLGLEALENMTRRKSRSKEKKIEKAKMKVMDYTKTLKKCKQSECLTNSHMNE